VKVQLDSALLDRKSVAAKLSVSQRTVDNLMARGLIGYCKIGRAVRFLPKDVEAFIASHRVSKTKSELRS
jgi:excisionase family DNA binding protein